MIIKFYSTTEKILDKIKSLFGYCSHCRRYFVYPKKRRMSSAYDYEPDNWDFSCKDCYEEQEDYWAAMWRQLGRIK